MEYLQFCKGGAIKENTLILETVFFETVYNIQIIPFKIAIP